MSNSKLSVNSEKRKGDEMTRVKDWLSPKNDSLIEQWKENLKEKVMK